MARGGKTGNAMSPLFNAARPESVCKLLNSSDGSCAVLLYGGFLVAPLGREQEKVQEQDKVQTRRNEVMITHTWNPIRELEALRHEVESVFEEFTNEGVAWPFWRSSFLPGRSGRTYPLVNLSDDKDALYVEALAPGINADTLDISVHRNVLRISGEKSELTANIKPEAFHRNERGAGKFVRLIELPVEVDRDKIHADYKDGLLLITLPKVEAAKPKQITVTVK